jgi:2-polyprenyl-3-methyl-5-hydroxy-6-metoxy-1,4-benzoquinol methylase
MRDIVEDYVDVAPPGPHRNTRAAPGEVRFFLETMLPRWLAAGGGESDSDWATLARTYAVEELFWRLADQALAKDGALHAWAARVALKEDRNTVFDPERALRHSGLYLERVLEAESTDGLLAEAWALRGRALQAADAWDEAIAAYRAAAGHGGSHADIAACAHAALAEVKDGEKAEDWAAALDAALREGLAATTAPADRLASAKLALKTGALADEAIRVLDALSVEDEASAEIQMKAALARLGAAVKANDPAEGRIALERFEALAKEHRPHPIDLLMVEAYRKRLGL